MKNSVFALVLFAASGYAFGQAQPTLQRAGDLQIGIGYIKGPPDYTLEDFTGYAAYVDFDFREHWGIDGEFHQFNDTNANSDLYERTYEIGPRYIIHHYGRVAPYAKLMLGRGVFNYPYNEANLAYNMYAIAGGADISVITRLNVRVEYEYQKWGSFPPNGLSPSFFLIGAAYHFPQGKLGY